MRTRGFSLIELMVTLVVFGILTMAAIPSISDWLRNTRLRNQVEAVARTMGLTLESVPTSRQAVRYCELDAPQLILVEEALHDERLRELLGDLRRAEPNFPVIEIARAPNVLEVANPWGDGLTRVSRDTLQAQLPSILVMELAKVV